MNYQVSACAISNLGKIRVNHEDNFFLDDGQYISVAEQQAISDAGVEQWQIKKDYLMPQGSQFLFAVSDGMGGHNAGEVASLIVVEQLRALRDYIFRSQDYDEVITRFQEYVLKANTLLTLKGRTDPAYKGMGATLTGFLLTDAVLVPFNLGDSRTYIFQGNELVQLTKDHTQGQVYLDQGIVTRDQLHRVDSAKSLVRFFGLDEKSVDLQAEIGNKINISERTWVLSCSDGLTDVLDDDKIKKILSSGFSNSDIATVANKLVDASNGGTSEKQGGIDNITVLLVEISMLSIEAPPLKKPRKKWGLFAV